MAKFNQEMYDSLAVDDLYVEGNEVHKKLKPIPPVIPVASEVVRDATIEDIENLPCVDMD